MNTKPPAPETPEPCRLCDDETSHHIIEIRPHAIPVLRRYAGAVVCLAYLFDALAREAAVLA